MAKMGRPVLYGKKIKVQFKPEVEAKIIEIARAKKQHKTKVIRELVNDGLAAREAS